MDSKAKADAEAKAAQAAALAANQNNQNDDSGKSRTPENEENGEDEEEPEAQKSATDTHIQLVTEMRTFRKYAMNRVKAGKSLREFKSEVLPQHVVDEMNTRLSKAASAESVRDIFSEYMADYQVNFLAETVNLKKSLNKLL